MYKGSIWLGCLEPYGLYTLFWNYMYKWNIHEYTYYMGYNHMIFIRVSPCSMTGFKRTLKPESPTFHGKIPGFREKQSIDMVILATAPRMPGIRGGEQRFASAIAESIWPGGGVPRRNGQMEMFLSDLGQPHLVFMLKNEAPNNLVCIYIYIYLSCKHT